MYTSDQDRPTGLVSIIWDQGRKRWIVRGIIPEERGAIRAHLCEAYSTTPLDHHSMALIVRAIARELESLLF